MRKSTVFIASLLLGLALSSCYRDLVPDKEDYFSNNVNFSQTNFVVNLGKNNIFISIFNADYSSNPLEFTIENPRHDSTGAPAPELLTPVDVRLWNTYYTGLEKSVENIDEKRYVEKRPALDIRPNSGEIFFWNVDSGVVKPGLYRFDVRVKNGGGERVFENMILDVRMPHPYEPFEIDDLTGLPKEPDQGGRIMPDEVGGIVDMLGRGIPRDSIRIHFRKKGEEANTISFKFFDADSLPIPLSNFNTVEWDSLKFNSAMLGTPVLFAYGKRFNSDSTEVTFDVPNPYPVLTDVSSGADERSEIRFDYNRLAFGQRVDAFVRFRFAIHEPGQWDIIFKFNETPKFEDD